MASLVAKKKGKQLYYYVVESARADGAPRMVHQAYLGNAQKVAALVKDRTAPLPLEVTALEFGLPGSRMSDLTIGDKPARSKRRRRSRAFKTPACSGREWARGH
jgi:hypothetical protein